MNRKTFLIAGLVAFISAAIPALAQVPGVNSTLQSVFTLAYEVSTSKPTYSSTSVVTSTDTAAADVCALSGSATKTLRVRRVIVGGIATSVESIPISILKHSTTYTAGNGTQPTIVPYDSKFAAATGVVEVWTSNPTAGTVIGDLADVFVSFANATTGIGNGYTFEFGQFGSPVFLRGVAQYLSVNLSGTNFNTGKLSCTFEWTEDNDS